MDIKNLNLFEYASRNKVRFTTSKGVMTVEDLWDLSLESLNSIAKSLNRKIKESEEEDFINKSSKSKEDVVTQVSFELVKYIIDVKLSEKEERLAKKERSEKRERLRRALEEAEDRDLKSKSADEIKKMLDELEE
jgi:hypothetical protein